MFDVPGWRSHRAGQHVDIRLTAEDGYQAQRSYSIASSPAEPRLRLTVLRFDEGEVSPYLTEALRAGDHIELRGPIGGHFVWEPWMAGPLQLVGGGAGITPLRAILRLWAATGRVVPARLLYSARTLEDVIFREELMQLAGEGGVDMDLALTREWPAGWHGHRGRVDAALLGAGPLGAVGATAPVRVRPDGLRRGSGESARAGGPRALGDPDGAIRGDRRLRCMHSTATRSAAT